MFSFYFALFLCYKKEMGKEACQEKKCTVTVTVCYCLRGFQTIITLATRKHKIFNEPTGN